MASVRWRGLRGPPGVFPIDLAWEVGTLSFVVTRKARLPWDGTGSRLECHVDQRYETEAATLLERPDILFQDGWTNQDRCWCWLDLRTICTGESGIVVLLGIPSLSIALVSD
jgi:hypothetical protein